MSLPSSFSSLEARLGRDRFVRRLQREHGVILERGVPDNRMNRLVRWGVLQAFFRATGLWHRGRRNADELLVTENRVAMPGLPSGLRGFRLVHLADLHVENNPSMTVRVAESLAALKPDLVVLTGDYRAETEGPFALVVHELARLRRAVDAPCVAILGNHDPLELVPNLEDLGYVVLLNEGRVIPHRGASFFLAGVDDPHFFQTHDLDRALASRPAGLSTVLLSHTTQIHREAEAAGVHLMLSGHTHGGQFCLPGGLALVHNVDSRRSMLKGPWRFGRLQGYTSRGIGCTGIPLRFNCPPELVVHTLETA
jgi:uncharacterized protein